MLTGPKIRDCHPRTLGEKVGRYGLTHPARAARNDKVFFLVHRENATAPHRQCFVSILRFQLGHKKAAVS